MDQHLSLILINLLVKLGLAAAVAAGLVRWVEVKSILFRVHRVLRDKIYLILWLVVSAWIGKALALGVWIKFAPANTLTGDLSFETTFLLGALAGRSTGAIGGALLAVPGLFSGAWLMLPLNAIVGALAGQLRHFIPHDEEIWSFSPFNYLSVLRWMRRSNERPSFSDWQMVFFLTIILLRFFFTQAGRVIPGYALVTYPRWVGILGYATSVTVIVIEL